MINSEVPAALFCGVLKNRTKTGIAKKPPPIPNKPVSEPIISDNKIKLQVDILFSGLFKIGERNIETAAVINTIEKPTKIALSGILSTTKLNPILVIKPKAHITEPSLIRTSLDRIFGISPDAAAKKTTASDAVVAATGVKSNKYKNIGTETIAPPAPINPSTEPMKAPHKTATTSRPISIV